MGKYVCEYCGEQVSSLMRHHCPAQASATPVTGNPKELEGLKKTGQAHMPEWPMQQQMKVHNLGAEKYGHFNWREEGVDVITYVSAARRHMNEYLTALELGDAPLDPESGAHVLAHVCACCNIIMDAELHGKLIDNYSKPVVKEKLGGKPSNNAGTGNAAGVPQAIQGSQASGDTAPANTDQSQNGSNPDTKPRVSPAGDFVPQANGQ